MLVDITVAITDGARTVSDLAVWGLSLPPQFQPSLTVSIRIVRRMLSTASETGSGSGPHFVIASAPGVSHDGVMPSS
ncbi:MAG: hypothetical protein ACRDRZ_09590 [Pseudonocardiaceae bacterium]